MSLNIDTFGWCEKRQCKIPTEVQCKGLCNCKSCYATMVRLTGSKLALLRVSPKGRGV